ncbi:MAG: 30S ribosomal protein S4 [Candidatus Nanoarchaeia archaeon]|jgi:small subunit ribosomal protein S4
MRKLKKKFSKPMKPWEKQRIIDEKILMKEYAYKNKREIWRMKSEISSFRAFAKKLVSVSTSQDVKERDEFLKSMYNKGLIKENAVIDDVLSLTVRDISERRLQTLIFRKSLARTTSQARQLITHGRVFIGDRKVTAPSTIVSRSEEALLRVKSLPTGDTK